METSEIEVILQAIKSQGDSFKIGLDTMSEAIERQTYEQRHLSEKLQKLISVNGSLRGEFPKKIIGNDSDNTGKILSLVFVILMGMAGTGAAILKGEQRIGDIRFESRREIDGITKEKIDNLEKIFNNHQSKISGFNAKQFETDAWVKIYIEKLDNRIKKIENK